MRTKRLLAAAALALAAVSTGLAAIPASAAPAQHWVDSDGFEGDPWIRWERFTSGDAAADVDYGKGLAHTGQNNGWLWAAHGWAAERMKVSVGAWQGRHNCQANIWAQPVDRNAQVELQVWDPHGWRLLTSTAPFLSSSNYQNIITDSVDLSDTDTVYIQAIYGNSTGASQFVRIDDATLECI
jgi:hypothetical protein